MTVNEGSGKTGLSADMSEPSLLTYTISTLIRFDFTETGSAL